MVEQVSVSLSTYKVNRLIKQMVQHKIDVRTARVLLYGVGYQHNRGVVNPMMVEVYHELLSYGMEVLVYDEEVDATQVWADYAITVMQKEEELKVKRLLTYDHRLSPRANCIDVVMYGLPKKNNSMFNYQEVIVSKGLLIEVVK